MIFVPQVTDRKLWAKVARVMGAPDSMTDKSTVMRKNYEIALLDFEQVNRQAYVWNCAIPLHPAVTSQEAIRKHLTLHCKLVSIMHMLFASIIYCHLFLIMLMLAAPN